jgi:DNA-binding transcriptional ArsR family regulator
MERREFPLYCLRDSKTPAFLNHFMKQRWAAVLAELASDTRLEAIHLRLIILMNAWVPRGSDVFSGGERHLAKCLQVSQSTISRRLTDLANWNLIEKLPRPHGNRAQYRMRTLPAWKTAPAVKKVVPESRRGTSLVRKYAQSAATVSKDEIQRILTS